MPKTRRTAPSKPAGRRPTAAPKRKSPSKRKTSTKAAPKRGFIRGSAGRERVDVELKNAAARKEARDKQRSQPFRFRMKSGTEGREIVVLDDSPNFFMYEHSFQNTATGFWDIHLACCQEFDTCAACDNNNNPSYNMVLSVIDLQSYRSKSGDEVPFTRKLFIVKSKQHKKFLRQYEKNGTLRGARFVLARDGDKDPVIGSDIEFDGFMEEEELEEYQREWTDRENKLHTEDCSQPYDYDEVFDEPDPEVLRDTVGSAPVAGSSESNESTSLKPRSKRERTRAVEEEEEEYLDEDEDEIPWEDDVDGAVESAEEEEEDEDEDEEDEAEESAESEEEFDEEEEEDEPEEKPTRRKTPPKTSRRGRKTAESAPKRTASARRRSSRRA